MVKAALRERPCIVQIDQQPLAPTGDAEFGQAAAWGAESRYDFVSDLKLKSPSPFQRVPSHTAAPPTWHPMRDCTEQADRSCLILYQKGQPH